MGSTPLQLLISKHGAWADSASLPAPPSCNFVRLHFCVRFECSSLFGQRYFLNWISQGDTPTGRQIYSPRNKYMASGCRHKSQLINFPTKFAKGRRVSTTPTISGWPVIYQFTALPMDFSASDGSVKSREGGKALGKGGKWEMGSGSIALTAQVST